MLAIKSRTLGLDIGSSSIKWILYAGGKKPVLYKWGIKEIPTGWVRDGRIVDSEGLAAGLNEILKELKGRVSKVSLSLSCPEMIIRTVVLPRLSPKEMDSVIRYEMEQLIPAGTGDYMTDYRVLGVEMREGTAQLKVLIAAVPSSIVGEYIELFKSVNLKPQVFDFHGNSIARTVGIIRTNEIGHRQVVVDAGASTTTVTIVENGVPVFTRLLQNGGGEITRSIANTFNIGVGEAEQQKKVHGLVYSEQEKPEDGFSLEVAKSIMPTVEHILKDIYRSVEFYKSRSGLDVDSIILAGGGSCLKGIGTYFASSLGLKEVSIESELPPLSKGRFPADQAGFFANAMGLAFRSRRIKDKDINLLPEEYRELRKKRRAIGAKAAAALLISAAAASAIMLPLLYLNEMKVRSTGIQHEIVNWDTIIKHRETKEGLAKLFEERKDTVAAIRSLGKKWSIMLKEISGITPGEVRLESVNFTNGEKLVIYGAAPDYSTVARFVVNLQNLEGITSAQPVSIALLEYGDLSFEVSCVLRGEKDGE